jgi:polyisoprenyl-teichoic acid--peptidoglycan teichoic acid transferase
MYRFPRFLPIIGLFLTTSVSVAAAGSYYVNQLPGSLSAIDVPQGLLDGSTDQSEAGPTENYLLVGTDSRENASKSDADYGGIIDGKKGLSNTRSDVMLVLRFNPKNKQATLLSIPRDLRVTIADSGKKMKINSAYERDGQGEGVANLVQTIKNELKIPISHFVVVDFNGFKQVVDAIGGVKVRFQYPSRDTSTGLDITQADCENLGGVDARQYVRSRHMQIFYKGKWHDDESADIGRMARQQDFLKRAMKQLIGKVSSDPSVLAKLLSAMKSNVRLDAGTDPVKLAKYLRPMASGKMASYTLPNMPKGDDQVMVEKEAAPILAFFRGEKDSIEEVEPTASPESTTASTAQTTPSTTAKPKSSTSSAKGSSTTEPEPTAQVKNPLDDPYFLPIVDC